MAVKDERVLCLSFLCATAFKRIVQRLKIEVLFLPELHPGCAAMFQGQHRLGSTSPISVNAFSQAFSMALF